MKTTTENVEVGVIVARFQSPIIHDGHLDIITKVTNTHPRVMVFLGLSPLKCTKNNPLDFAARKFMMEEKFPNIEVHYIEDCREDEVWTKKLDGQIHKLIGPGQKVVLYGSRDSFINSYKGGKYTTIELVPDKFISAREIRRTVGIKSKASQEWREGVIHAVENQYPKVIPTVDFAIVNFDKLEVLLARKPEETLLRFPGGYSDTNSNSYEEDVKREAMEETKLEVGEPIYIGSTLIKDWRYEHEQDKVKTAMFVCQYIFGAPQASDDVADVRWVKFDDLKDTMIVEEHRPLLGLLVKYLNKVLMDTKGFKIKL